MLRHRFKYDGIASVMMSNVQLEMKQAVEKKIIDGIYKFEKLNCLFCGENNFELLAEKDRYGLYAPVQVCKECGLLQITPRMTQESYNGFYNNEYRKLYEYHKSDGSSGSKEDFFEIQLAGGRYIHELLSERNFLKKSSEKLLILEVGCGAGGILKIFKDNGYNVKGIDLGEEYLEYGKKAHGLDLEYGDINSVKLDKAADVIIYNHVFEHLLNPIDELKKIREIIADDGILYIEVPGILNIFESKAYKGDFITFLQNAHICHFTKRTLSNMLFKGGFEPKFISEGVTSISSKAETVNAAFENDYEPVMEYLKKLEKLKYLSEKYIAEKRKIT